MKKTCHFTFLSKPFEGFFTFSHSKLILLCHLLSFSCHCCVIIIFMSFYAIALPFYCSVVVMFLCHFHVIILVLSCFYVTAVPLSCHCHVIAVSLSCSHVIFMSLLLCCHVFYWIGRFLPHSTFSPAQHIFRFFFFKFTKLELNCAKCQNLDLQKINPSALRPGVAFFFAHICTNKIWPPNLIRRLRAVYTHAQCQTSCVVFVCVCTLMCTAGSLNGCLNYFSITCQF